MKKAEELGFDKEMVCLLLSQVYRDKEEYDFSARELEKVLKINNPHYDTFQKNKIFNEIEILQRKIILESHPML